MASATVARLLFRLSRLAERVGLKETAAGRLAKRLAARLFLRAPTGLPASALRYSVDGLRFSFPRDCAFVFARPDFERGTRRLLAELLEPGMTVVDVGANVGFLSVLMARAVGPAGRLFAIEPAPGNVRFLRHNLAANGFAEATVLPVACGAARHTRTLYLRKHSTLHSLHAGPDEAPEGEVEVEERPLDELIPGAVDLVKVDTEGAELEVLEGMIRLLADSPGIRLVLEWNPPGLRRAGHQAIELPRWLRERGFGVWWIDEREGTLEDIDPLLERLERDELPTGWFGNVYAVRPALSPR